MKKILTLAAMMLLTVMGLSACTAKTNKANGRSSESHQARLNGRVVTDEGKAKARMLILGDWINHFTYAVYDGDHLLMLQYIEGESRP